MTAARRSTRTIVAALVAIALATACSGSTASDAADAIVLLGPRAIDTDREMMMVVDSIDTSQGDTRVRVRVANLGEQAFDVGAEDTFYAPLIELKSDDGDIFPALAVEPAIVEPRSVGHFDLRIADIVELDAAPHSVTLNTSTGPIVTEPFTSTSGDTVQWHTDMPTITFSDLSASGADGRSVRVLDIADRGTLVEVGIRLRAPSARLSVGEVRATLTAAGRTLESLPFDSDEGTRFDDVTAILRFPGYLPLGSKSLVLTIADVDVEIPLRDEVDRIAAASDRAELAQLPDLIHAKITTEPFPRSVVSASN